MNRVLLSAAKALAVAAAPVVLVACGNDPRDASAGHGSAGQEVTQSVEPRDEAVGLGPEAFQPQRGLSEILDSAISKEADPYAAAARFAKELEKFDRFDKEVVQRFWDSLLEPDVSPQVRSLFLKKLVYELANRDDASARLAWEMIFGTGPGNFRSGLIGTAFGANPELVLEFSKSLLADGFPEDRRFVGGAAGQISKLGAGQIAAEFTAAEDPDLKEMLAVAMARNAASRSEVWLEVGDALAGLQDPAYRGEFLRSFLNDFSQRAPGEQFRFYHANKADLTEDERTKIVLPAIYSSRAGIDPIGARYEISGLGSDLEKRAAAKALFRRWNSHDQRGVSEFVAKMEPGVARDEGASRIVSDLIQQGGFKDASAWVRIISDDSIRHGFELRLAELTGSGDPG
ncbi:MAG: hypothetical protein R3F11_19585 [Verrucomicrobiales bacterium]